MKIYFKLNLLKLAQPMIRPIEATVGKQGLLDGNRAFPQGDVVAYRFFVGRLRLFEDQRQSRVETIGDDVFWQ